MDTKNTCMTNDNAPPLFDDRVKTVSDGTYNASHNPKRIYCIGFDTPKKIYGYLCGKVWKQDAAKKAAAIITYNSLFRGVKKNAMFMHVCAPDGMWEDAHLALSKRPVSR